MVDKYRLRGCFFPAVLEALSSPHSDSFKKLFLHFKSYMFALFFFFSPGKGLFSFRSSKWHQRRTGCSTTAPLGVLATTS